MLPLYITIFLTFVLLASTSSKRSDLDVVIRVPEKCRGMQYCPYKPEGYELIAEKMDIILRQFLKVNRKSYPRSISNEEKPEEFKDSQLSRSQGILSPESDWHNCPYETKRVPLYQADYLDENKGEVSLIVQTKKMRQIFTIVTCAKKYIPDGDEQCFQDLSLKTLGLKSECEQIYTQRNVYTYNVKEMKIDVKSLSLPVACACKIKKIIKSHLR